MRFLEAHVYFPPWRPSPLARPVNDSNPILLLPKSKVVIGPFHGGRLAGGGPRRGVPSASVRLCPTDSAEDTGGLPSPCPLGVLTPVMIISIIHYLPITGHIFIQRIRINAIHICHVPDCKNRRRFATCTEKTCHPAGLFFPPRRRFGHTQPYLSPTFLEWSYASSQSAETSKTSLSRSDGLR